MDTLTILFGCFIIYSIIKEYLFYRHMEQLEKKLMSKDLTDYTDNNPTKAIDPDFRENKITKEKNTIYIEDMKNPFLDDDFEIRKGETKL